MGLNRSVLSCSTHFYFGPYSSPSLASAVTPVLSPVGPSPWLTAQLPSSRHVLLSVVGSVMWFRQRGDTHAPTLRERPRLSWAHAYTVTGEMGSAFWKTTDNMQQDRYF